MQCLFVVMGRWLSVVVMGRWLSGHQSCCSIQPRPVSPRPSNLANLGQKPAGESASAKTTDFTFYAKTAFVIGPCRFAGLTQARTAPKPQSNNRVTTHPRHYLNSRRMRQARSAMPPPPPQLPLASPRPQHPSHLRPWAFWRHPLERLHQRVSLAP